MRFYVLVPCFLAASVAVASPLKVATVDMQLLLKEYPGTPEAQRKLDAFAQEKKQDLADSEELLKELRKELDDPESPLSRKERRLKEKAFESETKDYQEEGNHFQEELVLREQEMVDSLTEIIKGIVTEMAQRKGFNLVLDSSQACYARSGVDLTQEVLRTFPKLEMDSTDPDSDTP